MRLKKLEIFGFKTFPEKTTIHFQPGITCIVGPNGCGKSNVVDSILWVMGEQSTKTLRGDKMEDVIFFGSESRKTIGLAEVTLTIGDIRGELPSQYSEYSEIEITRRLFRSGESEYLINKVHCRLKDIRDILIDAGIGFKGHTVIEQGRVEKILTSTPEDRRAIIEDTAGIMKYKFRKTEALRKLESTQHNLLRVRDIISEVKRQINSLDRQVRKAKDYQELAGSIRERDVALTVAKYIDLDGSLKDMNSREESLRNEEMQALSEFTRIEADGEETRTAIIEEDKNLASMKQFLHEMEKEIGGKENRLLLIDNQMTHQNSEIERISSEIARLKEDISSLSTSLDSYNMEKVIVDDFLSKGEDSINEVEGRYEAASREFHSLQETIENARKTLFGIVTRITEARNREVSLQSRASELARLKERIVSERNNSLGAISDVRTRISSTDDIRNSTRSILDEKQRNLESLSDKSASLDDAIYELTDRLNAKKELLHRSEARYHSLEEMEKNLVGYQEGVRSLFLSKAKNEINAEGVRGIVADFFEVTGTEGFSAEKVIETVLGDRLQNIVVTDHGETKKAIEFLKTKSAGRSSFIPVKPRINGDNAHLLKEKLGAIPISNAVIGPALNFVTCKDEYRSLAEYLLSDVIIVDNLDTALSLWNDDKTGYTFATLDGEIVEPGGRIAGGVSTGKSQGLIEKRKELKNLKGDVVKLGQEVSSLEGELERTKDESALVNDQIEEINSQTRQTELSLVNTEKDLEALRDEEERRKLQIETLSAEEREIDSEVAVLNEELRKHEGDIHALVAEQLSIEQHIQELIETQRLGRERWEEAQREVTLKKLELATQKEKRESLSIRIKEIELRIQEASGLIDIKEGEILKIRGRIEEYLVEKTGVESAIKEQWLKKEALCADVTGKEQERNSREERLKTLEEAIKDRRRKIEGLKGSLNQIELQKTELRLQIGHLKDSLYTAYQVELEGEIGNPAHKELLNNVTMETLSAEVAALKEKLNRMGPVNLASIEEYQELNQRYEFMTTQEADLTQACETLHSTISKINKTTKEMFINTFNIINEKFQQMFQMFFQGGTSRLALTDENNVLESGIEIIAQPPGKRVSQLALLSGGEKALTAMSLLFATFLARPTPFCVLDEIDAPLDETNTERYIRTLREMMGFSQFVVITHNKRTMEGSDMLYGVTMEEPGVSKLISVHLAKREKQEEYQSEMALQPVG
ncbi:MAG: chromosome segregation protein SMC [Nitrospirae bacterium]|nr:chromosome segregation protein SMC [Nitrospirota bacterium]